jgi:hypothetical protein
MLENRREMEEKAQEINEKFDRMEVKIDQAN